MKNLFLLIGFLWTIHLSAQPDPCKLKIGTNLAGPADWGSEWPFVNIMKYARTWITFNAQWIENGMNAWDTDVLDSIPRDADGYPLQLPYPVTGAETTQIVRTVWANTESLPAGTYVVLWDGNGSIEVGFDASNTNQTGPNRLEFDLTPGANDIFYLAITQSQAGNHVRNIRVLLPGTEASYATDPWESNWFSKLEPFQTIRFMDWGYTNNSEMQQWTQRTHTTDYTWTQKNGVPYEFWIRLCNRKNADAWVCVPHLADSSYIAHMAELFRDSLEPGLKIYVEYSNELWNWMFQQAQYGLTLDPNLSWPERLGPKIASVLQIWQEVFGSDSARIIGVLGCQHAWFDIGNRIYQQIEALGKDHLVDAISPAAYMGLCADSLALLGSNATGQEILQIAQNCTFNPEEYWLQGWHNHAQLAQQKNKRLLFYEGGQHFTPEPFGTLQPYCQALMDCQTLPGMYNLYHQLFDTLQQLSTDTLLFMNFSFIGPIGCQYGSWGVLENQFTQSAPYALTAPKYQALLDHLTDCESTPSYTVGGKIYYPNADSVPLSGVWVRLYYNGVIADSSESDALGNWQIPELNPGTYTLSVRYPGPAGGINSLDALIISRHFTGMLPLTGIREKAADVNGSGYINSTDALLCLKRFVGLIPGFAAGNQVIFPEHLTIQNSNILNFDIQLLHTGDTDASFHP